MYRNGQVKRPEAPSGVDDEAQVIATSLTSQAIDLEAHGINPMQAAELRARLASFAEDWNQPDMDVYDNYDTAKHRA